MSYLQMIGAGLLLLPFVLTALFAVYMSYLEEGLWFTVFIVSGVVFLLGCLLGGSWLLHNG